MRIEHLDVFTFPVPFKLVFRHASASRSHAENLIVAASADGRTGYGEGCPRYYVTGETVASGSAFIHANVRDFVDRVHDLASLAAWAAEHRESIDANPAAFCAMETAVLDLLGRIAEQPVEEIIGVAPLKGGFAYSAVLGDAPYPAFLWQFGRYRRRGFSDFKVKLSGDPARDRRKMRALAGRAARVRLDANNLFPTADDCIRHLQALPGEPFAVEEPLAVGDLEGLRSVADACRTRIVLDESLLRAEQITALTHGERWIANVRLSKMGGILRSLEVVRHAMHQGLGIIVGCQVGETSILTRAALPVMQAARPNLVAAEGAFGTHLLRRDLASPSLMFGTGGVLASEGVPQGNGFGLSISAHDLKPQEPL